MVLINFGARVGCDGTVVVFVCLCVVELLLFMLMRRVYYS